jgi:hypothetical protein
MEMEEKGGCRKDLGRGMDRVGCGGEGGKERFLGGCDGGCVMTREPQIRPGSTPRASRAQRPPTCSNFAGGAGSGGRAGRGAYGGARGRAG